MPEFPLRTRKRALLSTVAIVSLAAIACGSSDDAAPASSTSSGAAPAAATSAPPARNLFPTGDGPVNLDGENAKIVEVKTLGPLDSFGQRFAKQANRIWTTNFEKRTIELTSVLSGGVPRDGIPPIDNPKYKSVSDAPKWLDPDEPVIAVEVNGDARAFPLNILLRHEIVNTVIGGDPVVVTYCPLCNSSLVFRSVIDGVKHRFGVSGFLRNSDLIMWDDKTQSWWQQLTGDAIVGDYVGRRLVELPSQTVSWSSFASEFPNGGVMDRPRGRGGYDNTPYTGYDDPGQNPFLFLGKTDPRADAIDRVSAIDIGTGPVAYHFDFLRDNPVINDQLGDTPLLIIFDGDTESAFRSNRQRGKFSTVGSSTTFSRDLDGQILTFGLVDGVVKDDQTGSTWSRFGTATDGELKGAKLDPIIHGDEFWFAWAAFKPDTRLIESFSQLTAG